MVAGAVAGVKFNVLLPSDYATSGRSYPVLYLLHGAAGDRDDWLDNTDLEQFTRPFTGRRAAIVVMPGADPTFGFQIDWRDRRKLWDTLYTQRLIPYIDAHFRTQPDRAHRAIAGWSAGGYSSMLIAARHPDLFVAAGAFSGFPLDLTDPIVLAGPFWLFQGPYYQYCEGDPPASKGLWGYPGIDDVWLHNTNPSDLAENLATTSLYISAGSGAPCNPNDVVTSTQNPLFNTEAINRRNAQLFDGALSRAGVAHTTDFWPCGIHTPLYFQAGLHHFWPQMARAFGSAPPVSFKFRSADHAVTVWGWSFTADPKRAAEFLDIHQASATGLTVTDSGTEHVTTAPLFAPGAKIHLTGATTSTASADGAGRISLDVDLGPAHQAQQYTPGAVGERFVTRTVRFTPPPNRRRDRS